MTKWTENDIPSLGGKTAVVTGANSGIGYEAAKMLADHGATVLLAVRNEAKGSAAAERIRSAAADSGRGRVDIHVAKLDIGDRSSVQAFAEGVAGGYPALHLLINNAGVMAVPRALNADGNESQFGGNHLGHFALTGLLLPTLLAAAKDGPPARVVTVSSGLAARGTINFEDLQGERRYTPFGAYNQSKLANLLFALELDRRAKAAGADLVSTAVHPGYAATNLQARAGESRGGGFGRMLANAGNALFAQSARAGAWPTVYAATHPDLHGGEFVGPTGMGGQRGAPGVMAPYRNARDERTADRLWTVSETLTGIRYDWP
jgi:NAD(P)-dependent dehydrogenase (short-subunit alcohol dehydrogenase family)